MGTYGADVDPAISKMRTVAFTYRLAPQTKLKGDQFSTDDSKKVYHLVVKIGSTNLSVLVEPADVPG